MSNILVTTMGLSWQNLPKILGLTNPNVVDLYRFHPSNDKMKGIRNEFDLQPVDEIWIMTTEGKVYPQLDALHQWHALLEPSHTLLAKIKEWPSLIDTSFWPVLKIFQVAGTDDMISENECRIMKEAILRIVMHAAEYASGGQLLLTFAGGSNTMSADMQLAATMFGCHALIHVVDAGDPSANMDPASDFGPEQFTGALPADYKDVMTILVTGTFSRNMLLGISLADMAPIQSSDYPIVGSENGKVALLEIDLAGLTLSKAVADRLEKSGYLAGCFTNALMTAEQDPSFPSLYSLPSWVVYKLKHTILGIHPDKEKHELEWLNKLPKAALHCQLEGVLDALELIRVANANYLLTDRYKMRTAFHVREWRRLLDRLSIEDFREQSPLKTVADAVRDIPEPVSLCAFIQLFNNEPEFLDELIYGRNRVEAAFVSIGLHAYEALGDLQGIRLLQSEASIRETCRILVEKAVLHNVRYLEVRCSPIRYVAGGLNPIRIVHMIEEEIGKSFQDFSIVFTVSRHRLKSDIMQLVNLAKRIMENPNQDSRSRLRGFDLAENEITSSARDLRKYFFPFMEKCQHITVNTFGNVDVAGLWEAVYHLNAERISHGLTLKNNTVLIEEFLDRKIAVEMCPSSNFQILGFRDNYIPGTDAKPVYPLKDYLDMGLKVSVNPDHPGISRTDFTRELHRAARMTPVGLSIWNMLKIVHNGFKTSFADHTVRNRMLREAEKEIIDLIQRGIPF
jgi:adenosine deaminase